MKLPADPVHLQLLQAAADGGQQPHLVWVMQGYANVRAVLAAVEAQKPPGAGWHVATVTACVTANGCFERRRLAMPGLLESLTMGTTDNVLVFGTKVRCLSSVSYSFGDCDCTRG